MPSCIQKAPSSASEPELVGKITTKSVLPSSANMISLFASSNRRINETLPTPPLDGRCSPQTELCPCSAMRSEIYRRTAAPGSVDGTPLASVMAGPQTKTVSLTASMRSATRCSKSAIAVVGSKGIRWIGDYLAETQKYTAEENGCPRATTFVLTEQRVAVHRDERSLPQLHPDVPPQFPHL